MDASLPSMTLILQPEKIIIKWLRIIYTYTRQFNLLFTIINQQKMCYEIEVKFIYRKKKKVRADKQTTHEANTYTYHNN